MKKAAIYTRKSKFTQSGESIETQINLCRDYAKDILGIKEFVIYEDEGFSGGNTKRPNFQRMLEDCRYGLFDAIICYRLDRVSRNIADFSKLIRELEYLNIKFVSIKEQFDTSTPMGRAMMNIAAVFAQLERETIAERVRDNMLELAKSGRWLGGVAPTGFESKAEILQDINGVKRRIYRLSPVYKELETVKLIYTKFLELKSLLRLVKYLSSIGIKSKNNRNYDVSSLKIILSNPVYAVGDGLLYEYFRENNAILADDKSQYSGKRGVISYNKYNESKGGKRVLRAHSDWIIALGNHPGIIPSRDWIEAQNLLSKDRKNPSRRGSSKYALLTSILYCSKCGSPMGITSKYSDGMVSSYYYKCTKKAKTRGGECSCPNLNGAQADEIILNQIKSIKVDEASAINLLYHNPLWIKDFYNDFNGKIVTWKKQINKYTKSIDNLIVLLSENEDLQSSRYIVKEIEELHFKKKNLEDKINKLTLESTIHSDYKDWGKWLQEVNDNMNSLDIEFKKRLVSGLINKILWDGETLEVYYQDGPTN